MSSTEDIYREKLSRFKKDGKPEALLLIADNPELVKIIVAWTTLDIRCRDKLSGKPGETESETWDWLWRNTEYSLSELAEKTGISLSEAAVANRLKTLIGNRIIYPDGTVNTYVERYLREQVLKLFEQKKRRPGSGR